MELNNSGIHTIMFSLDQKGDRGIASFFIPRNYGNYLFFGGPFSANDHDFFYSKGGIYKQFYTNKEQLGTFTGKIFDKYGAYIVFGNEELVFLDAPSEKFGKEFFDRDMQVISHGDGNFWYLIKQKNKTYLIVDDHVILHGGELFPNKEMRLNQLSVEKIQLLNDLKIEAVLFSRFEFHHPFFHTEGKTVQELLKHFF